MGCCTGFCNTFQKNAHEFRGFLWNGRTREICGRTAKSWIEILIFYLIFYSLLACFWAALLYLRISQLPEFEEGPFHNEYLTHRGPGMSLVPTGDKFKRDVAFDRSNNKTYKEYEERIKAFFEEYTTIDNVSYAEKFRECNESCTKSNGYLSTVELEIEEPVAEPENATEGESAEAVVNKYKLYNLDNLGECGGDNFGFEDGEPCFYFTVNKAWDWVPEPLSDDDKPAVLKNMTLTDEFMPLHCSGVKSRDVNNIEWVKIFPESGFKVDYFPWLAQKNYRPPIVAAKIKIKPEAYGHEVRVECRMFADNVHGDHRKYVNIGRVEVDLTITESEKIESN